MATKKTQRKSKAKTKSTKKKTTSIARAKKKVVKKKATMKKKVTPKKKTQSKKATSEKEGIVIQDSIDVKTEIPTSVDIEENERLVNLERLAGYDRTGRRRTKRITDECKDYLGQLAWYWRLKGLTFQQIANKYDVSIGMVYRQYQVIAKQMQEFVDKEAEYHVNMELMRLDEMLTEILPFCKKHTRKEVIARRIKEKIITKVVEVEYPPATDYIDKVLKIMERRSKFLGLDKPVKTEVDVNDRKFVVYGPPKSTSAEEWAAEGGVTVIEEEDQNKPVETIVRH